MILSKSIEVVKTASNNLKLTPKISSKRKEPKEKEFNIYILFFLELSILYYILYYILYILYTRVRARAREEVGG